MNTDITKTTGNQNTSGWVLYDGQCVLCRTWVNRWQVHLAKRGLACVPLQTPWVRKRLSLVELPDEMKLLTRDGCLLGGVDALAAIARTMWWTWPAFALAQVPGVRQLLGWAYQRVAKRRYCLGGKCSLHHKEFEVQP